MVGRLRHLRVNTEISPDQGEEKRNTEHKNPDVEIVNSSWREVGEKTQTPKTSARDQGKKPQATTTPASKGWERRVNENPKTENTPLASLDLA